MSSPHATGARTLRYSRVILRTWTRAELDRIGPHDLSDDAIGIIELDLIDGRSFDVEVLEYGTRWRDGETGAAAPNRQSPLDE